MAFPFTFAAGFRQQLILAIGTTSLASTAALGCAGPRRAEEQVPGQQMQLGGSNAAPTKGSAGMTPAAAGAGDRVPTGASGTASVPMMGVSGMAGMSMTGASGAAGMSKAGDSGAAGMSMVGGSGMGEAGMSGAGGQAGMGPVCSFGSERECFPRAAMESQAKYGCGMIANPPARFTDAEVQQHFLPNGCLERALACNGCCNLAASDGEPQADGSCCYMFCSGSCCGRPLIVEGQARLASVERRSDWLQAFPGSAARSGSWDARIASEWLEDARMEHASIASFARFTLDLLQFGAPSELVELAQRAGLEEIAHARMCFGLASRYGASASGPGPLSVAEVRVSASLFDAACAAFEEGCIGETCASLQARAALELATDVEVRRSLSEIAQQEAAHAELAWRFVSWAVTQLGPRLARELQGRFAQRKFTPEPVAEHESADAVAALHAAGRLTGADKHRVTVEAMRDVIAACVSELERVNAERNTCEAGTLCA